VGDLPHKEKEHPIFCFSVTIPISQPKPQIYNLFPNPIVFPKRKFPLIPFICRVFSILDGVFSARGRSPAANGGGDNGDGGRGGGDAVLCAEPAAIAEDGGG